MNKKADMKISTLIFGVIVMTMLSLAGMTMLLQLVKENPSVADRERLGTFNRTFSKLSEITTEEARINGSIGSTSLEGESSVGPLASLMRSTWSYIKLTVTSVGFVQGIFSSDMAASGIPFSEIPWFGLLIGAAITFVIGFVVFRLIFGGDGP